ncbi:hypothetical protein ACMHYT_30330 [Rhodococcus qingshengii]|uniref:hypothetical protein n=1 Tax=Rhodococcus qingshengii TaxID=334542 RepID=UPI0039C1509E
MVEVVSVCRARLPTVAVALGAAAQSAFADLSASVGVMCDYLSNFGVGHVNTHRPYAIQAERLHTHVVKAFPQFVADFGLVENANLHTLLVSCSARQGFSVRTLTRNEWWHFS